MRFTAKFLEWQRWKGLTSRIHHKDKITDFVTHETDNSLRPTALVVTQVKSTERSCVTLE